MGICPVPLKFPAKCVRNRPSNACLTNTRRANKAQNWSCNAKGDVPLNEKLANLPNKNKIKTKRLAGLLSQ